MTECNLKLVPSEPRMIATNLAESLTEAIRPIWRAGVDDSGDADYYTALKQAIGQYFGKISIREAGCLYHTVTAYWSGSGGEVEEKSIEYVALTTASDILCDWASHDIRARTWGDLKTRIEFLWRQCKDGMMDGNEAKDAFQALRCDLDLIKNPDMFDRERHFQIGAGWNECIA